MGRRKGVGTIRTFGNLPDRRRRRTVHGAYVELATLALHRKRLLQEYKLAKRRSEEISDQIRHMEAQAKIIQRLAENPDEPLLESIRQGGRTVTHQKGEDHAAGVREMEFDY
jgi:hypothetical protein